MRAVQPKPKRFVVMLFQSHLWYAGFMLVAVSIILVWGLDTPSQTIEIRLWQLIVLLSAIFGGGLIFSWQAARRMTRPLEEVAAAIKRMAEGNYGERLPLSGIAELLVIQQTYNTMAESLEQTTAENQQLQIGKQRMLADLSHDLKTPIATIQGYAKALELGYLDNKQVEERYVQLIQRTSDYVAGLVDQLAVMTQLDRADYPAARKWVDAAELLREIVTDHYEWLERESFQLEVDIAEAEVPLYCDPQLIYRAVSNLLSNAIKHNPPGTFVSVHLQTGDGWLQMIIADRGEGIPEEWRERVFEPFVRVDQARQKEGAGLGLAIAGQVAEMHGGSLLLRSRRGETSFILQIPFTEQE